MMKNFVLFLFICISFSISAQTGINTYEVNKNAALHVESPNKDKGFIVPRLTTAQRDQIKPLDTENGLIIYNTDEDCINFWNLQESAWKSVCGVIGKADFKILRCEDIKVFGQYKSKKSMEASNFISVQVQVDKIGTYSITALAANGYYFNTSGEFLSTGSYTIQVPAMGQPLVSKVDTFTVSLNGEVKNGTSTACTFTVNVENSAIKPDYEMNCNSSKTKGVYKMNVPLTTQNFIEMEITASASAVGATYVIESNEVDGIKFRGSGILSNGVQIVRMYGSGTPITTDLKRMTVKSNSTLTAAICYANVRIVIPKKRLLSIGMSKNGYGYNFAGTAASNKLITEAKNYGTLENSIIAFEGWGEIKDGGDIGPGASTLRSWLLGSNPYDILVIGYYWNMREDEADVLMEYLLRGGVVLAFTESNVGSTRLLRRVTSNNSVNAKNGDGPGAIYTYSAVNDKILNGPFGDIRNLEWGEDASYTSVIANIDKSDLYVYSDSFNMSTNKEGATNGITAFRHREYNLVWVGDGGFNSNSNTASSTICPFKLNANNFPVFKTNYGSKNKFNVYNSVFTANVFGWALDQADKAGINSSKFGNN